MASSISNPSDILFDDLDTVILIANENGEIVFANQAVSKVYGLNPESTLGIGWWKLTSVSEQEAKSRQTRMAKLAKGELDLEPYNLLERAYTSPTGKTIWTQWTNSRLSGNRIIGVAQDISKQKGLEAELIQKNKENELLLQEVYHRVKNNLQIILSLLRLEFAPVEDKVALASLKKSMIRIDSMALIHAQLCETTISKEAFSSFFKELLNHILRAYANGKTVSILSKYDCESIQTELLVNIGLLITELVTNSIEHAFSGQESGEINVEIVKHDTGFQLTVKDNGNGLPQSFDQNNIQSLGFDIIHSLVEQLDGKMNIKSNNGTEVTIFF